MIGNREKIQIALPFIVILISLIIGKFLYLNPFEPPLTQVEKKILGFVPERFDVKGERHAGVADELASPFEIKKRDFPSVSLSDLTPQGAQADSELEKLKLTMIIIGQNRRNLAIVNGLVLKEGDIIGDMKLERIEKNRILLKSILAAKKSRWLLLEEK